LLKLWLRTADKVWILHFEHRWLPENTSFWHN